MDDSGRRGSPPLQDVRLIPEVYSPDDTGYEQALRQLDNALVERCPFVIIEPHRLGDETSRWIAVGNFLHKSSVLSGLGLVCSVSVNQDKWQYWLPFSAVSLITYSVYTISWAPDPCSKYQVERNKQNLARLPINGLSSPSPIVLVFKDDIRRRYLHSTVAGIVFAMTVFKIWRMWISL